VQKQVGANKLTVALIDVDPEYYEGRTDYLPKAKQIMDRLKLDWPNALAQNGFNDVKRAFNASGYGNIVVDAKGIVRGINVHDTELERLVETMLTEKKEDKP
jgi:hypothetical protein